MSDVINLISSDEERPPVPKRRRTFFPILKQDPFQHTSSSPSPAPENDDITIVSHVVRGTTQNDLANPDATNAPPSPPPTRKNSKKSASRLNTSPHAPEAVQCVGERKVVQALVDYPHFRFQCITEPFKNMRANKKLRFCERCFCYVCDIPAADCRHWTEHSKAVDSKPAWRAERDVKLAARRMRDASNPLSRLRVRARHEQLVSIATRVDDVSSHDSASDCLPVVLSCDESDPMIVDEAFNDEEIFMHSCVLEPDSFTMKHMGRILEETDGNAETHTGIVEWDARKAMSNCRAG